MSFQFSEYNNRRMDGQQARRMDRKTIKLEAAYGSERQFIVVTRKSDLIVHDLMEEVQRVFKIPLNEQVIFHKGTCLTEREGEYLEDLGVENNHPIRVTRDPDLPHRSPRRGQIYPGNGYTYPATITSGQQPHYAYQEPAVYEVVSPRHAQPQYTTTYTSESPNDVLKLDCQYSSHREYINVQGKKPLMVYDLKLEVQRVFKIPIDQQSIVFKGYNVHEYQDDTPLAFFEMYNNSQISVWPKGTYQPDYRLSNEVPQVIYTDQLSARIPPPPANLSPRWVARGDEASTEVLKVEVQHGSDRHQVILKGENKNITVADLQREMERITAVPIRDQRMFFKSQELHTTPYKTLKECDIENNHVIKMVGDPARVRYSNYFGRLNPAQPPSNADGMMQYPSSGQNVTYYSNSGNPTYGYQYP